MGIATDPYRECFLYVDADNAEHLLDQLAAHFDTAESLGTLRLPKFEIDVVKNALRIEGRTDDFVDWRTKVEVYADEHTADDEMVRFVTELMSYLRSAGYRVVAACDFEDELPQTDFR
jgi:hypothetical protein